jgi:hypothetical protein
MIGRHGRRRRADHDLKPEPTHCLLPRTHNDKGACPWSRHAATPASTRNSRARLMAHRVGVISTPAAMNQVRPSGTCSRRSTSPRPTSRKGRQWKGKWPAYVGDSARENVSPTRTRVPVGYVVDALTGAQDNRRSFPERQHPDRVPEHEATRLGAGSTKRRPQDGAVSATHRGATSSM